MRKITKSCLLLVFALISVLIAAPDGRATPGTCGTGVGANESGDHIQLGARERCGSVSPGTSTEQASGGVAAAPPTQTVDCGPPTYSIGGGTPDTADDPCRMAKVDCSVARGAPIDPRVSTVVTLVYDGANWTARSVNCASRAANALTGLAIRQEAIKLLPVVPIRSAPADGNTFVNLKTVLWMDSPPTRALGPVTLLGHQIGIQITAAAVRWDFGDGVAVSGPLGKPYDTSCDSKECPGFWGHDYAATGNRTVTATVRWSATYTVDGGPAQPVPGGLITRGATTLPLTVREARDVLVPNPGN